MTDKNDIAALKELVCKLTDAVINVVARSEAGGWERAAKWVDARRESYDREHSQYDTETGMTEFSNAVSEEYSTELYDIAEGLRAEIKSDSAPKATQLPSRKGEQVPVALVDERQGSGGFCLTQHGRKLNLPHGTELFTVPQKPVVHPDTKRMDWLCSHVVDVREPLPYGSHSMFWSQCDSGDTEDHHTTLRAQVDAAIEAAGGVVSDK